MIRTLITLPDLPTQRTILNPARGAVSVIIPVARTNLITNGSFETNTTNWTASGGSIARSTTQQYHGAYSLAVTPTAATTDGVFYGTVSLTSGTTYAASAKVYGAPGVKYKISFATTGGVDLAVYRFVGTGRWQWVWVYYTETSSTTRRIYITKDTHTSAAVFYIDGVQVEALESGGLVSTYIDGDQRSLLASGQFPPAYGWNGTRHASTSYRTAQARDGGMVKNLDLYKLLLTAIIGLGLVEPSHLVSATGYSDGAVYQTSVINSREFTLSARLNAASPTDADQQRRLLTQALNLDATAPRQPVAMLYQKHDDLTAIGDTGKIIASYKSGLAVQENTPFGEDIDATFVQWLPFIAGPDQGAALTQSESITVSTISNLMYRDATGDWSRLSTLTGSDSVQDIIFNPTDGKYYMVGAFTSIGGTSANRIVSYDPNTGTFAALSTGLSGTGQTLHLAADGKLWVGGTFNTAGGTTVNNVTYWDGSAFNAIGGGTKGVNNTVLDIVTDAAGVTYITGLFTQAGGSAAAYIVRWTGSAFSTMSSGLAVGGAGLGGYALGLALNGTTVYVGGVFGEAGGKTVNNIAQWINDATGFLEMEDGVDDEVDSIAVAASGDVYIGGLFDNTTGGLAVNKIARWNGTGWSQLGSGFGASDRVSGLTFAPDGLLYASGVISTANGIATADSFSAWNGSSWILPDIDMAGSPTSSDIAIGPRGELMVFFFNGTASNASAAAVNTLTNSGTAVTYPTITIAGPTSSTSRLHQIRSYTTGAILSFNLTIFANEFITITTGPDFITVLSNVRGDLSKYVLPGSARSLPLVAGSNSIAVLITGGTVTAVATWQRRYNTAAELSYAA